MKRFRFSLDSYLGLLRSQLETVETRLAELRGSQIGHLQRGDDLLRLRQGSLKSLGDQDVLGGARLRDLDAWRTSLTQQATDARRAGIELDAPIAEVATEMAALRQRVELMDRLRSRRLADHQRAEDREIEQLASEVHLAKFHRRGR